ncbi:FAD-dependent monooxygenase [Martelella soudanensis]|uniref:FAD-dependent monooxygenase n=2 Tax=unclassified Martelella TaxID=2629616 RepID=UPI0015DDDFDD|nr:FAD-dependent monooxygenase [Martelella sp. NC20]
MNNIRGSQVTVVGAGPTGLMLACELKLLGVNVTVVERRSTGTGESRAPGINARTMEIFGQRGLADLFLEKGRPLPAVLFSGIPMFPGEIEACWPDALILPQHETERILTDRAIELGVAIEWGAELLHFSQDAGNVKMLVQTRDGIQQLHADYLVGCDGGHSTVRRLCGATFHGDDPVSHWVVADVQLDSPPSDKDSFGRNIRVGTYQVSRIEPDWFRVSLMRMTPPADRSAPVTLQELRQTLFDGLGTDYGLRRARWISRFADGFRQVDRYRNGRVFLAGDAGHTHSPIGGQGLNLGIQDAVNLGWKLATVINHGASDTVLDTYHEERHPVAEGVLQIAKAQTALIKPGSQIEALRHIVSQMLAVPEVTLNLAGTLSGLSLRYAWGDGRHPLVGRRMPNLMLDTRWGKRDVFSFMHAARPVLFGFGDSAGLAIPDRWASRVDVVEGSPEVDQEDSMWRLPVTGRVPALASAFVRPDGYVAWVGSAGEPYSVKNFHEAFDRWLG